MSDRAAQRNEKSENSAPISSGNCQLRSLRCAPDPREAQRGRCKGSEVALAPRSDQLTEGHGRSRLKMFPNAPRLRFAPACTTHCKVTKQTQTRRDHASDRLEGRWRNSTADLRLHVNGRIRTI